MTTPEDAARPDPWAPPDASAGGWGPQQPAQPAAGWGPQQPAQPTAGWAPPPTAAWGPQPWGQPPSAWGPQPWGWAPPPPDPRAQRRKRWLAFGALASVVVLLVGALSAAAVWESRRDERVRADVARVLPGLKAFVERERGLAFKEDVDVEVLDDDAFLEALYEEPDDAEEPELDPEATLTALGLVEPGTDLEEEVTDALDEGVVGFYDPEDGRLVVRGRDLDAFVEMTIVHELTHALQDQHFELHRPDVDEADDERSLAFTTLIEGDAGRVEEAWLAEQSLERQLEVQDYYADPGALGDPDVVDVLLGFPYIVGPAYVGELVEQGGQPAVDAAFTTPPTTSEQVLVPGSPPAVAVPEPEAEGEVVDRGALGALGLALVLGEDLFHSDVVDRWDGDRYVTWADGDRSCTLAHIAAPDPAALQAELVDWAVVQDDAQVSAGPEGTVRLRACV